MIRNCQSAFHNQRKVLELEREIADCVAELERLVR
jgi:hypothetical protein